MKKTLILLIGIAILSNCGYVRLVRHLEVTKGDTKYFDQSGGLFEKTYSITSASFINAITENINTTSNATIENLEIQSLFLEFSLAVNNTATTIQDMEIELGSGWGALTGITSPISNVDLNKKFLDVNEYLLREGADMIKNDLESVLNSKKSVTFGIILRGFIPPAQVLRGNITFKIKCSLDAVTCEQVPIGLGPSECMILPVWAITL